MFLIGHNLVIGKNFFNICTMLYVKMLHSTISTEIITLHSSKMSIISGPL